MRSATRFTTIFLAVALVSLLAPVGWAQTYASASERQLFDAANRERQNRGLSVLKWDEALAKAAHRHAVEMAKQGTISHQFPGEPSLPARVTKAGARFTSLAENVAQAQSARQIHDLWMHSPGHRANLLDKDMDSVGIGIFAHNRDLFAVEDFSRAK